MWIYPLLSAVLIAALMIFLHLWNQSRSTSRSLTYRSNYLVLLAVAERVVQKINQLAPVAEHVKEEKLLDLYEGAIKLVENLLSAMQRLPHFGQDGASVRSGLVLARECESRVDRVYDNFKSSLEGGPFEMSRWLPAWKGPDLLEVKGCYFCSKPPHVDQFRQVRTKINGIVVSVWGCQACRDELKQTGKAKVLYFTRGGQPIHWSHVKEYKPTQDFWGLNQKGYRFPHEPKLKLVISNSERVDP